MTTNAVTPTYGVDRNMVSLSMKVPPNTVPLDNLKICFASPQKTLHLSSIGSLDKDQQQEAMFLLRWQWEVTPGACPVGGSRPFGFKVYGESSSTVRMEK
jgi:hypothetical protein